MSMMETQETQEPKHVMAIMGPKGDLKVMWDPARQDEVDVARKQFDELTTKKNYVAFRVTGKEGEKGEQIRTFDPEAGRIILAPQIRGGR